MRYAEKQLTRPQCEGGCDYGSGRRSVLARNGRKELLHIAGQKHWGGVACEREYSRSEIVLWDPSRGVQRSQQAIHEGRLPKHGLADHAEAIYAHLGVRFPIELISLKHTLLLDEAGEVDGPPPRAARRPKINYPRFDSDKIYRVVYWEPESGPHVLRMLTYNVLEQRKGSVSFTPASGKGYTRQGKHSSLFADGYRATPEAAKEAFLAKYRADVDERVEAVAEASRRLAEARDELALAEAKVAAM